MPRAKNAKDAMVMSEARHPERTRGILERFLPSVEMTRLFLCELSVLGAINFLKLVL
jgi:hypothetical protein